MSTRFYTSLWIVFFAAAAICWLIGALSMLTVVVFGFIAFGLIFAGMMCVLPTEVAHSHEMALKHPNEKPKPVKPHVRPVAQPERAVASVGSLRSV